VGLELEEYGGWRLAAITCMMGGLAGRLPSYVCSWQKNIDESTS